MAFLYKRGNIWYGCLWMNGERVRKPLSGDKQHAQILLGRMIESRHVRKYGGKTTFRVPFAEFEDKYVEWSKTKNKRQTHLANTRAIRELKEARRKLRYLAEITPALVESVYAEWKQDGRGLYVRNRDLRAIKTAMHKAESWGMKEKADWSTVKEDREPKGRLHYFTPDDVEELLKHCSGIYHTLIRLCFCAGLRLGEAHALRWEDVDFELGRIHVAPYEGWNPKDFERRFIPMSASLRKHLSGAKRRGAFVLMRENGERPSAGGLTQMFHRIAEDAGVRGSIHSLRHGFASEAIKRVPIHLLSRMMGHSSIKMTEKYSHVAPADLDECAKFLP